MKRAVGKGFIILLNILVFLALALLVAALPKTAGAQIQVTPVPDPLCRTAPVLLWRLPCNEYHNYVILRYVCETFQPVPNHCGPGSTSAMHAAYCASMTEGETVPGR